MSLGLSPSVERFVHPEPNTGCWFWTGGIAKDGYGMAWDVQAKRTLHAHRLTYAETYGPIPKSQWVLHRCDMPACVNPEHLFLGTAGDNNRDCHRKGRSAIGERHGMNKISAETAAQIRVASGSQRAIAKQFGVSQSLVWCIKSGRLWKNQEFGQ